MYISIAELREYLDIEENTEDHMLEDAIEDAQEQIDDYTQRTFEAAVDTLRHFTVGRDTKGRDLYFDDDICAITTIVTNADNGSGGIPLTASDFFPTPRNRVPYFKVSLASSSSKSWEYTNDPEGGITVLGRWAFSITPPKSIRRACYRLAGYNYKQADAQVYDVTALPEQGVIMVPKGMPVDVMRILDVYRKLV